MRLCLMVATGLTVSALVASNAQAADCASAKSAVAAITAKLPIEVDAVTNTTAAASNCAQKQVVIDRKIDLKQSRMEADYKDFLQKQDDTAFCVDKASRVLVDTGWDWTVRYTFQDGEPVNIKVSCK